MPVTVAIVAPPRKIYDSLHDRAESLAAEAGIVGVVITHLRTIQDVKNLLVNMHGQPLCMCCDVLDGPEDTADALKDYLAGVWRDQDVWLRQKPLIIISESDQIVNELQAITRRHGRDFSGVFPKLPVTGANRWKNIRNALLEGIINA